MDTNQDHHEHAKKTPVCAVHGDDGEGGVRGNNWDTKILKRHFDTSIEKLSNCILGDKSFILIWI